jgi:hypothetical protein
MLIRNYYRCAALWELIKGSNHDEPHAASILAIPRRLDGWV